MRRFYVDVHRLANKRCKNKNEENYHVYSVDGESFGKANRITDIPVEAGDELYVDTIPLELTEEFTELLRRGVKVFYLRRLTLIASRRKELGLSKTSRNDVKALMSLEKKWFREADVTFISMRLLISAYRGLMKTHQALANRAKSLDGVSRDIMMDGLKKLEELMSSLASVIVEKAYEKIPLYNKVVESLGISGDNFLSAREALAELMIYVNFTKGLCRVKNYCGLFGGKNKRCSESARIALERLTLATKRGNGISARDMIEVLRKTRQCVLDFHERTNVPA